MKNIVVIALLLLAGCSAFATNYYLSNTGNDSASGTSASTAWRTITKLNTATYSPGDTVFFKSGDTFRGNVNVNQGGSMAARLVFTSYGSLAQPIISGAIQVTGWTQSVDTFKVNVTQNVRNFFVDEKEQILARYPNEHHYLWLDSARTNYLLDIDILGIPANKVTGSKVCIHTAEWCWEKSSVSALVGDTVKFTTPVQLISRDGFGYYLYDNITHLDTAKEWKYNSLNQTLYYRSVGNQDPSTMNCEATVYNYGIQLANDVSYVTIENLHFEKQYILGVGIPNAGSRNNIVDNCTFMRQGSHGVQDKGKYNEISNSYFGEVDGIAIYVYQTGGNCTIHHNTFRNIGQQPNGGIGQQINLSAIMCAFVDSCYIHHNDIDSTGYCGISVDGAYNTIERNVVRHTMLWNNDGAGLKSYGHPSHHNTWQNNFTSAGDGTLEGTSNGNFITPGIYFDFGVNQCIVKENTIFNHAEKGIFQNSGDSANTIIGNVVYGGSYGIDLNGSLGDSTVQRNFEIKHNTLFALDDQSYCIRQVDYTGGFNVGAIDSNNYFQPYNASRYALRMIGMVPTSYNFASWQATGFDAHTQSSFVNWTTGQNDSRLFMNQTDTTATVNLLDSLYLDLDSVPVCGSLTLLPYTSKILINTLTLCNPVAVNDPELSRVVVYPNPTEATFMLHLEADWMGAEYRLMNAVGQVFATGQIQDSDQSLSLAGMGSGMYLLEITGKGREVVRVMKQ